MFAPRSAPGELPEKEDWERGITTEVITVLPPAAGEVAEPQCLAPRLPSLQGTTVGLIGNHKRHADVSLAALGRLLHDRYGVSHVGPYRNISRGLPTPAAVLARRAGACAAILHAVAG